MKRQPLLLLSLIMIAMLVLAACTTPATPEAEEPATETETTETEETAEELETIAAIAAGNEDFSTLVTALDAAGLVDTFAGEGAFTVFAPTNDAFAALPEGTLDALLADPQGALTDILTYHVVDGAVLAEQVVTLDSADTLNGAPIAIAVTDNGVMLNDNVMVTTTDIVASNGVIHVIDAVLLPPSDMAEEPTMTIAEIAAGDENFSTLVAALDAAGLVDTFAGGGEFTVFAPTNDAFAALPEGTLDELLAEPQGALTDILTYHVVDGTVLAEQVVTLDSADTLNGAPIAIAIVDGGVVLNDSTNVTATDIKATNGVIHVIDSVLLPPSDMAEEDMDDEMMEEPTMSIAEIAAGDENFSTLVTALDAAGLVETFAGEGEFTVFAPTNDAFAALGDTLDTVLADPQGLLTEILTYHVVDGVVLAEQVVTLDSADTLNGAPIAIAIVDGGVVLNDNTNVTATDIKATNGVIHVIDSVLLPPSDMAEEEMEDEMMEEPTMTIAEIAAGDENFSTLVTALDAAGLVETFAGEGAFTVFAPTNDAFAALGDTLDTVLADPQGLLTEILTYHVVDGIVLAEQVVTLDSADTLNGAPIAIAVVDEGVVLNDNVNVVATDIKATNGVIHVIDAVLVPPAEETAAATPAPTEELPSIAAIAAGDENFSTLVTALDAAGLVETLDGEGEFTVFAPTNDAFAEIADIVAALLEEPEGALTEILLYHVVPGVVTAEQVVELSEAPTLFEGHEILIEVDEDGNVILNGEVMVTATDIEASNGIIHVIDTVLLPPAE